MIYNESNKRQEKIEEENMKKLVAKLLVASVVLSGVPFSHSVSAEVPISGILQNGNIEINETNFPDPVVRQKVTAFDTDGDHMLSIQEREAVTSIFWQYAEIRDVTGLSYFPNVEYVDLSGNYIENMNTSNWLKLKTLYLMNNQLTTMDVSRNPELEILHLLGNYSLTGALNLMNNSNLKELHVNDTSITSIVLPETSALVALSAGYNPQLTSIIYPKNPTGSAIQLGLTVNAEELYKQDREKEKGTYVQWKIINGTEQRVLSPNETVPAYGCIVTATWEKKTYTLSYQLPQGISWVSDEKKNQAVTGGVYGEEITLPSQDSFKIEAGYEWKGWTVSSGSLQGEKLTVTPNKDGERVIVSPKISKIPTSNTYTMTFEKGEGDVKGVMKAIEKRTGTILWFPECNYTREGYHFVGWKLTSDGMIYKPGKSLRVSVAGEKTAIAQWEPNTGTIVIGSKKIPVSAQNAGVYTLTDMDLAPQIKEGYQFNGWKYNGKRVEAGQQMVLKKNGEKLIFEGDWYPNKYFVEYVQEDGTPIETQLLTYGVPTDSYKLNDTEDKVFVGWKRSDKETYGKFSVRNEEGIYYSNESLLNLTAINGDTVRLEAVYKEKNRQMVIEGQIIPQMYTGSPITPAVSVKVGDQTLVNGVDYDLVYSDHVNVGIATVKVVSKKAEYDGTSATFEITKAPAELLKDIAVTEQKNENEEYFIKVDAPISATVRYRLADESTWSSVVPKISIGTAVIEYEITDPNYEGAYIGQFKIIVPEKPESNTPVLDETNTGNGGSNSNNNNANDSNGNNNSNGGSSTTPSVPGAPSVPSVPSAPSAPSVPSVPSTPSTPNVPTKPENSDDKKEEQQSSEKKEFKIPKVTPQVYTGTKVSPKLVIKDGSKKLIEGKDYTVQYKNNNKIGKATAIITGIGDYKGMSTTYSFVINPKKPTVQTKIGKSSIKITTKAQKGTKQMIQYSQNGGKTWKTIKTSAKTKMIKGLKKGTYKIRVCSYKIVKGVTYKSAYTTKSTVKIK